MSDKPDWLDEIVEADRRIAELEAEQSSSEVVVVPVTYVDGGAMLPPKLAEDAT